ncbi:MAG: HAD family phosphatase [Eubacterium sp.]
MTEAIIFDMDGLMFDTESVSLDGWVVAGKVMGYPLKAEMVYQVFGHNPEGIAKYWHEVFGEDFDTDEAMRLRLEYIEKTIKKDGIRLKPGLIELLDYLKTSNYRFAIASSSQRKLVEMNLKAAGVAEYFDTIVGGDEIIHGKPAPDIYLKASEQLGVLPGKCMVLEDSPAGIESGQCAGMKPVMIPDLIEADEATKQRLYAKLTNLTEVIDLLKNEKE